MTLYFRHSLIAAAVMILLGATFSMGASVTVTSSGPGVYAVQGSAMGKVSGMELNLTYDAASHSSPKITQGGLVSGALLASNTTVPGTIKIAIIGSKPFSESGLIASISFATHDGVGGITSVTSNMIDSSGATVASVSGISGVSPTAAVSGGVSETAGVPFQTPPPTQTPTQTPSTSPVQSSGSSIPTYLGTVNMPSDVQDKSDSNPSDPSSEPAKTIELAVARQVEPPAEAVPVPEPQKPVKITITSHKGTLENFRVYKGVKTPGILVALINKEITPAILQEPAFALSDGRTPVSILVNLKIAGDKSPNFALNGAKLVSLNKDAASTWIIEALPRTGVVQAGLTIMTDSNTIEYPLTVAPPVEGISSKEADFVVFLADSGAAAPKYDLNGDGKHNYLDDFIFTANYLLKKGAADKPK